MLSKIPKFNQETEYVTQDEKGNYVVKSVPKPKGMQMQAMGTTAEDDELTTGNEVQAVRGTEVRWTERVNKVLAENQELKARIEQLEGE